MFSFLCCTLALAAPAPPTARLVEAAHGGNGVVPADNPTAYHHVIAVVDLTLPDGGPAPVVAGVELLDARGAVISSMRQPISVVLVDGSGAEQPLGDRLQSGVTRVRVHVWMDRDPPAPAVRVRVTLRDGDAVVTAEGPVGGPWPTG